MIKVLHCADIHLGDLKGPMRAGKNARREDTLLCMRKIAEEAESEKPNVSIIAGDLFNRSRVWADTALEDINDAINVLLKPLCALSEQVVLLYGTQSHDNPNAFDTLRHLTVELKNLHIFTKPEVKMFETSEGMVQILAMPGVDKGHLKEIDPEADSVLDNEAASEVVNKSIRKLSEEAAKETASARILVAHYTVAGCESESGQKFMLGQDVAILPKTIDDAKVTLACMGHIHKPQKLDCVTPAYYCGSPNQLTFNDEGIRHGFYFHEIDGDEVRTRQIPTPERRHLSIHLSEEQVRTFAEDGELVGIPEEARDAIVRVYYKAASGQEKALNRAILQKKLEQDYGVFYVSAFLPEDTGDILMEGIGEEEEPREILHAYLSMKKEKDGKLTDEDIKRIEELADPILQEAEGKRATGRGTGAFRPKRIHVENYRCYKEEEFDFTDIQMAMVSGQNGAGKSSLFMDAIVDCLYEKGGRGDGTGDWVRTGASKGSITFEFEMGGSDYKVSRSRKQGGTEPKLVLYRMEPATGEWKAITGSGKTETQTEIDRVMGMDCNTFCSIALIRQDAYGIFAGAKSKTRMEVLSGLLGLGIYDDAEKKTKEQISKQRDIAKSIDHDMLQLDGKIELEADLKGKIKDVKEQLEKNDAELQDINEKIRVAGCKEELRKGNLRQAEEKEKDALKLQCDIEGKTTVLEEKKQELADASKLASMADEASKAAEEVKVARRRLETLSKDEATLLEKQGRVRSLEEKISGLEKDLERISQKEREHGEVIGKREEIERAKVEAEQIQVERAELVQKSKEYKVARELADIRKQGLKDFQNESQRHLDELANQIRQAEKKTSMLESSGCPIADNASCEFLKDAQAAKAELEDLRAKQKEAEEEYRRALKEKQGELNVAQAKLDRLQDPQAAYEELDARERGVKQMADLAGILEAAQESMERLSEEKRDKESKLQEARKEWEKLQKEVSSLQESAEEARNLREAIKDKEKSAEMLSQCAVAEANVNSLKDTIRILSEDIEKGKAEANRLRQQATELRGQVPKGDDDAQDLQAKKEAIDKQIGELHRLSGALEENLKGITDAKVEQKKLRDAKSDAARKQSDYETLREAFGLDGIQNMIIRGVVPEIETKSNEILSAMTGGKMTLEFRTERENTNKMMVNVLDILVHNLSGDLFSYESHSGGEKVKIALAVTLGLADVKAQRAGVQLGMLWIDEPPFLDSDGTDAYADALASMAERNPGMKILAISHDPEMKAQFPQNITVIAGEDGSMVVRE